MPSATVPITALATGPGYLLWAPLGTSAPGLTVSGSKFTDAWTSWNLVGVTDEGSEWSYELDTENVEVAEYLDPAKIVTTGRNISMSFAMANISASNLKLAMNGGTITTSGSGATSYNEFVPVELGSEVRCMIGWESEDSTERLIGYQCFQQGGITIGRKKGADKALIPCEFGFERPSSGPPFKYWTAGTARA